VIFKNILNDFNESLKKADKTLYQAKQKGKNRVVNYSQLKA